MSGLHSVVHGSLAASGPYLTAVIAVTVGAAAVALIAALSGNLSARGRHAILSVAVLAPVAAALVAASGIASAVRQLLATPAPGQVTSAAIGGAYAVTVPPVRTDWICTLFTIWAAGAAVLIVLAVARSIRWTRIARRAEDVIDPEVRSAFVMAAEGIGRLPRLAASPSAAEPMVVGLLRPAVLLPARYVTAGGRLTERELRSVLTHELEHVRRHDNLTAVLLEIAAAVFWFDPLHWMARRRMLELRERACDERVLDLGCGPDSYISALAKGCHAAIESPVVACMSGFHVKERIESIMSYESRRSHFASYRLVRALAVTGAMALVVAFGALAPPPTFASAAVEDYKLNVALAEVGPGKVHVVVRVTTPAGKALSADAIFAQAKPASIETHDGDRTLKVDLPNAAAGQTANLEVLQGNAVIARASAVIQKLTKPSLPPPPAGYSRVSGDVKVPVVLTRVDPKYTEEARAERVQGIVILDAAIDEHGVVKNVEILKDLPYDLGKSAAEAVRQWTFQPATLNGKPVPVMFTLTVNFKLDGDPSKK